MWWRLNIIEKEYFSFLFKNEWFKKHMWWETTKRKKKYSKAIGKKRHYNKTDKHITLTYPFCHKAQGLSSPLRIPKKASFVKMVIRFDFSASFAPTIYQMSDTKMCWIIFSLLKEEKVRLHYEKMRKWNWDGNENVFERERKSELKTSGKYFVWISKSVRDSLVTQSTRCCRHFCRRYFRNFKQVPRQNHNKTR